MPSAPVPEATVHENREAFAATTKSGLAGKGWWRRQPVMPWARRLAINRNSVPRFPVERIGTMTCERFFFVNTSATGRLVARKGTGVNPAVVVSGGHQRSGGDQIKVALMKECDELKQRLEGIDPKDVRNLADEHCKLNKPRLEFRVQNS